MDFLSEELKEYIEVQGCAIPVNTDFRIWLKAFDLSSKTGGIEGVIDLVLDKNNIPDCVEMLPLILALTNFMLDPKQGGEDASNPSEVIYSFTHDAPLIFAAFYQQYGIDLCSVHMHWHKFLALFRGLEEGTLFVKVMGYRGVDLRKIKDREMQESYRKLKKAWALPIPESDRIAVENLKSKLKDLEVISNG